MKQPLQKQFAIIMAGGRGERFWPVSRETTPKQLIQLLGDRSLLQETVHRILPVIPAENILVITNQSQLREVRRQLPDLPSSNLIAEPCGRDTCAAITLGAALVANRCPEGVMAVLPADHVISQPKGFQKVLRKSLQLASRKEVLVTIGIPPTGPSTAYGYIRLLRPKSSGEPPWMAPLGSIRLNNLWKNLPWLRRVNSSRVDVIAGMQGCSSGVSPASAKRLVSTNLKWPSLCQGGARQPLHHQGSRKS